MALHPHAPKGVHPSAVPGWRGMLLNQDIQKLLLQAGTSQTPFHKLLQVQHYRTQAVCVTSPLSSVPVTVCACFGAHSDQRQQSTVLTHAKICAAISTLWGLSPGRHRQACRPENISERVPKKQESNPQVFRRCFPIHPPASTQRLQHPWRACIISDLSYIAICGLKMCK